MTVMKGDSTVFLSDFLYTNVPSQENTRKVFLGKAGFIKGTRTMVLKSQKEKNLGRSVFW